ncbi:alkaline phosphatase [Novosphingobium sp.]|uniref:alkaline phosphatase n=1 Tax=Novosphingobium sp. TaxID=1874826 RepID=UPI00273687AF|nr:alkaline phosphatase [Novosphingobium sp.]MDP3908242.1 alkaline phosphatase [Novosphingobium sp.]
MRLYRPACLIAAVCLAVPAYAQTAADAAADTAAYRAQGEAALERLKREPVPPSRARNVIIFIGDGMGVSTITAARIFAGQAAGKDGESFETAMDALPYAALVKTYSHDAQVSDSAPTATAIMAGIKTRNGMIGVGPEAQVGNCASGKGQLVPSLIGLAQDRGLATGVVTTTGITHATPASAYAQTVQRDWESDADMPQAAKDQGCTDIARQLIEGSTGARLNVVLGGGRTHFLPKSVRDPEHAGKSGARGDGRDLIAAWQRANPNGHYAWNRAQFLTFDPARHTRLLGLFEPNHMQFEADRAKDPAGEPSLVEMTETAIRALSRSDKGYVLLIEGGRIDHAHHAGNAFRALTDAKAFDEAVAAALRLTSANDTLIVTTADHSHTLTISGYPVRGNPILGAVAEAPGKPQLAMDGKGYTTLGYANGPGAGHDHARHDPVAVDTAAPDYRQQATVPLSSETHAGEDVAVRASGPGAHLLRGTIEQHTIFYVIREALFGAAQK